MRRFYALICLVMLSYFSNAQVVIEGVVKDQESGYALVGATIKSAASGTTTDINGFFSLDVTNSPNITISYIGYTSIVFPIELEEGKHTQNFEMNPTSTVLDMATVTGSKYERSIARSPVSINVVKPQLIANTNTIKINTLLDKLPGVQIVDNQAIIRGGSGWSYGAGSRVLLLIDDIPALQADAGRPLWGDIPVENISQIEVVKGASSTLYGSSAMNGIINIRTGYATAEPTTKAFIGYTHFMDPEDDAKKWWDSAPHRYTVGMVHKQKIGQLDLVANGFYENYDSYYQDGYERKYRLSANLKYRLNDRVVIGLNSLYNRGEAADNFIWLDGGPGAYKAADNTFSERVTTRYYFDPQVSITTKNNDRHKILGRYYYVNNDNNLNQANMSYNTYFEYQFLKSLFEDKTSLATGVVHQYLNSDSELWSNTKLSSTNVGAFVQLDHKLSEDVTLTGGLRYEHNTQKSPEFFLGDTIPGGKVTESKLISRVGINYKLAEGTFVRASWGEGYRYPTMAEKFIYTALSGFSVFPNIELQSESGWSSEIGIRQGVKLLGWLGYIDATLFWSQYDNMTEFTAQNIDNNLGFQSVNVGSTDIKGYEISLIGQSEILGIPVNILCGYTRVNPKYQEFEEGTLVYNSITAPIGESEKINFLKYRSRHNFKIDLEAMKGPLALGIAWIYVSEVVTMDALLSNYSQIQLYREAKPGGYHKLDFRSSFSHGPYKLSVLVNNALNKEYTVRPGLLEAPRNISLRIDVDI